MKRNIIFLAAAAALLMPAMVFGGGGSAKNRLYIYNWTYYTPESVIEKFEKEYGVQVIYD